MPWCMSTVEQGGHTSFPLALGAHVSDMPPDEHEPSCPYALGVKPEQGKVIIFYSLKADGTGDELSQHAACPVLKGKKWAANKWVWNKSL